MENERGLKWLPLCRMCGVAGNHRMDVLGGKSRKGPGGQSTLSQKILRCVGVRVERSDKTTKICGDCFCKIYDYARFRDLCATTDSKMGKSKPVCNRSSADAVNDIIETCDIENSAAISSSEIISCNRNQPSDLPVECVSLIDDETDHDNDERHAIREITDETGIVMDELGALERVHDGLFTTAHEGELNFAADNSQRSFVLNGARNEADVNGETRSSYAHSIKLHDGCMSSEKEKIVKDKGDKNGPLFPVKCRSARGCKESFESRPAMMLHVKIYHAKGVKKTFECHLCKKTSTRKADHQRHMNSLHTPNIRFMCPIRACAKIFTQKGSLKQHTDAVHIKKLAFKCSKCPMKFNRKQHLTRHLANKHGQGITFTCYLCKSSFGTKYNLKVHMDSLHTYQPRFKCPFPMCSKSFTLKSNLTKHTNTIHTEKTTIKCLKCPMKFNRKQHLIRHLANKHGQGITFTCYLCKRSFGFKQSLKRHLDSLHKKTVFQCAIKSTTPVASTSAAALARERELIANVDDADLIIDLTHADEAEDAGKPVWPSHSLVPFPWNAVRVKTEVKAERYEDFLAANLLEPIIDLTQEQQQPYRGHQQPLQHYPVPGYGRQGPASQPSDYSGAMPASPYGAPQEFQANVSGEPQVYRHGMSFNE